MKVLLIALAKPLFASLLTLGVSYRSVQFEQVDRARFEVQAARGAVQAAEAKFRVREGKHADLPEAVDREIIPLQPKAAEKAEPPSQIPQVEEAPEN